MNKKFLKEKIEEDFKSLDGRKLEAFFDKFISDKRFSFIKCYNKTVLDKEKIDCREFISSRNWAIRGMPKETVEYFNKNYDILRKEILQEKDIVVFFEAYCCGKSKWVNGVNSIFSQF